MSDSKPREYTHIQALDKAIKQLIDLITCHNRAEERLDAWILPRRHKRPPKRNQPTELEMNNELLRDFLQIAGRK